MDRKRKASKALSKDVPYEYKLVAVKGPGSEVLHLDAHEQDEHTWLTTASESDNASRARCRST